MTIFYFDTSALVKLYISEPGSKWTDQLVNAREENGAPIHLIAFSQIGIAETAAAIARRERSGHIDQETRTALYKLFIQDSEHRYQTLSLSDVIILAAADLTQRYPLRGYDAVHLSTALVFNRMLRTDGLDPLTFVSADIVLLEAAAEEGLNADNPNNH